MSGMHITSRSLARLLGDWRARQGSLAAALADSVAVALLDGRLSPGIRLPAERVLADELGVSRTTIAAAYRRLAEHDLAASRRGSGTVTRLPPTVLADPRSWAAPATPGWPAPPGASDPPPARTLGRPQIDLSVAAPPAAGLVLEIIGEGVRAGVGAYVHSLGYNALGLPDLRAAIADRFAAAGLDTTPDQILVTAGAQQGLDLVARWLLAGARTALVESPTYPGTLDALRGQHARLVALPIHAGWDAAELAALARQAGAATAFLTPDHHNPTGRVMSAEEREAIAREARAAGVVLVVDETLRELSLDAPVPPHLASYGDAERIVTIGSLSKAAWPGLRVGWVRAGAQLVARLAELRLTTDLGGSIVDQLAGHAVLRRLDEILAVHRARLAGQRDALIAALRDRCGIVAPRPPGGQSLWIHLPHGSTTDLALAAPRHGLRLVAGPRFSPDGALDHYLRLPYTLPVDTLREAAGRLAELLAAARGVPEISLSV